MATFVIVHGAWSGGHAWRWLRPLLRTAGHEVFTPTLTGLGERAHLAGAQVDLDTHIRGVLGVLEFEDLDQVVLVGHSYGGMVITGVADQAPQRLTQLVYLDAEVPTDGQCEFDLLAPEERDGYQQAATTTGQGWQIPPPVPDPLPHLHPAPAPGQPGGARGGADLHPVHPGQGRPGASRLCPTGPIRLGVAVCGTRGRPWSPRHGTPATRRPARPARLKPRRLDPALRGSQPAASPRWDPRSTSVRQLAAGTVEVRRWFARCRSGRGRRRTRRRRRCRWSGGGP
jgi:pimeloyl-ACP methyl ester carboxylesterase